MNENSKIIEDIVDNIKEQLKNKKDAPGLVFIPTYRTEEQLNSDEVFKGGILTNVDNVELLELAIHNAIRSYVNNPKYKKYEDELFGGEKDEQATQTAIVLTTTLLAALSDVDDWVKHIAALLVRLKDLVGENREITFSVLPKDISKGFDSATKNSGMVATANPNQQVNIFATMILSYCLRNDLPVEDFMNKVFGKVMTSSVTITKDGKEKSN